MLSDAIDSFKMLSLHRFEINSFIYTKNSMLFYPIFSSNYYILIFGTNFLKNACNTYVFDYF